MTFLHILKGDKTLAVLFVLLSAVGLLPLFRTTMLPFIDMNLTAGHGAMLFDVMGGEHPLAAFYRVRWLPVPYWSSYVLTALADSIGGTVFAAKALPGLLVVLLPAAIMRLLHALGRDPRLGLWAFMLNWERNLWAGWTAFLLGIGLSLIALAWLIEADSLKRALKVTFMAALVAVTHIQALAFLAVAGGWILLSGRLRLRRLGLQVLGLSGGLLAVLPWLYRVGQSTPSRVPLEQAFRLKFHPPNRKMELFFAHTFDVFAGDTITYWSALALLCFLIGTMVVATVGRPIRSAPMMPALSVLVAAGLLYLILPFSVTGVLVHKHNYVRFATVMLMGALLVPRTRLRKKAMVAVMPGVAVAAALSWHVSDHFAQFHERTKSFTALFGSMQPGKRMLPMIYEKKDESCKMPPLGGFHGILAGHDRVFDPNFFRTTNIPINYRRRPLAPSQFGHAHSAKFRKIVSGYDYVLVQGLQRDPFARAPGNAYAGLLKEAGIWRLYQVNREKLRESAPARR